MATLRKSIERFSAPLLISLNRLPKFLVPIFVAVLLVVGLYQKNALGLVCISLVALFIIWLSYLAWPVLEARAKVVRLVMIGLLLFGAYANFVG